MENGTHKSGLRLGIVILGLLALLATGSSGAKPSFKNTPLYRHIVKRRDSQPVRLYEKESVDSGRKDEAAPKPGGEKTEAGEKNEDTKETGGGGLEGARAGRVANMGMGPLNLMDPSTFTPAMPFSEAVEILRNSTIPRLNIAVLWKDLEENADIYPDTPIGIDGVSGVSLGRHLRSLVDGVSGGAPEGLGYVVDDGVIVIATLGSLPKRMVTRVYDITDLVGQPSQGGMMGGMMGGGMMGGMMPGGMMGGGMMGGGMMGGGMMGGGMMGGMMPGGMMGGGMMPGGMMGGMMPGGMMGGGMMGGMMPGGMMGGYGGRY